VRSFRRQLQALDAGRPIDATALLKLTEGQTTTAGAYNKSWR